MQWPLWGNNSVSICIGSSDVKVSKKFGIYSIDTNIDTCAIQHYN